MHFAAPHLIVILAQYKYVALIPLTFVAQPAVAMIAGMFVRAGYFDFPTAYAAVVGGALLGDVMWYFIGYHYGERFAVRFGKYFGISDEHVATVKVLFNRYDSTILLLSKITNGLGLAIVTLFTAGLSRIPFGRYMAFNLIGESLWSGMLIGIGFYFTHLFDQVDGILGKASTIGLFVIGILLIIGFSHWLYRRIAKATRESAVATTDNTSPNPSE